MFTRQSRSTLESLAKGYPIVAVTGPRQSGKTTLVQQTFAEHTYVSLEDPDQLMFANEDPRGFLSRLSKGAILDEVQRCPTLFSYLQTLVDANKKMGEFVITGSQNFGLLQNITQSLAGRVGLLQLLPFSYNEISASNSINQAIDIHNLLLKGLYPPLYDRPVQIAQWYSNYIMTYLERDLRQMIKINDLSLFQRFLKLCAARCGQLLNLTNLAQECGVTHSTIRAWISILEASYIIFLLPPFFNNFGKRLIKSPKLYFYDTGLVCALLNIVDEEQLSFHPMRGALFETFVLSELLKNRFNQGLMSNIYFWRDNAGNEIDFLIEQGQKLIGIEVKSSQTIQPAMLKFLQRWQTYLPKATLIPKLIYTGSESYKRSEIEIIKWQEINKAAVLQ